MLIFSDFKNLSVTRDVAYELHDRWVSCNFYAQHHYSIAIKIQEIMTTFCKITRYSQKNLEPYKKMKSSFLQDIDYLFYVYCADEQQKTYGDATLFENGNRR